MRLIITTWRFSEWGASGVARNVNWGRGKLVSLPVLSFPFSLFHSFTFSFFLPFLFPLLVLPFKSKTFLIPARMSGEHCELPYWNLG